MESERSETYNRVVVDIAAKLLPVLDNLKRALEHEASVEANESDSFGISSACRSYLQASQWRA